MPSPQKFLLGFGVHEGMALAGYKLEKLTIGHEVVKRYREYHFPMTFVWRYAYDKAPVQAGYADGLVLTFQNFVTGVDSKDEKTKHDKEGNIIVNSDYGNPYRCGFGKLTLVKDQPQEFPSQIIVTSTGVGIRVYE